MAAFNAVTQLRETLESVDKETFSDLASNNPATRFFAARHVLGAATSIFPEVTRSLLQHMDADALEEATQDSHWGVQKVTNSAVLAISRRFGKHLDGLTLQEITTNPLHVCRVLQQTMRPG